MSTPLHPQSADAPSMPQPVPRRRILFLTLLWALPLSFLLLNATLGFHTFQFKTYEFGRHAAIVVMLVLMVFGLLRAFDVVGDHKGQPWFTDPVLVALALFWGLFPPMWFFVEYLSFDREVFLLPTGSQQLIETAKRAAQDATELTDKVAKVKADFLTSTKLYADMAAKVWVAVGTALGAVVAMAGRP
ncbi:hypothetical protein [Pseudorhodoferax sp. Leaf267]|uniref:hypothetical protein n=1 Tax=Pseudorhodoferax sp. Leaf267 TaxID=1736316 RepID=UPI0012E2B5CE|nr:hypothetical protein [Pseudorhodoferax sp. Leaf267]